MVGVCVVAVAHCDSDCASLMACEQRLHAHCENVFRVAVKPHRNPRRIDYWVLNRGLDLFSLAKLWTIDDGIRVGEHFCLHDCVP